MPEFIVANEAMLRIGSFTALFVLIACSEWCWPRRVLAFSRPRRWQNHLCLAVINTLLMRILFPMAAVGAALLAQDAGWGLFTVLETPDAIAIPVAFLLLDVVVYGQHRAMHALPLLWRVHRVHHADLDLDITSGLRFHPIEMILSMAIKVAVVFLVGAPVLAVLIFEIVLNGTSLFNHANLRLAGPVDRVIRWIVVTPDMHRVHHSVSLNESNSYFGFNLPRWDHIFHSFRSVPSAGHEQMCLGLSTLRDVDDCTSLVAMLALPFRRITDRF